jgi:hypothetical protein
MKRAVDFRKKVNKTNINDFKMLNAPLDPLK